MLTAFGTMLVLAAILRFAAAVVAADRDERWTAWMDFLGMHRHDSLRP